MISVLLSIEMIFPSRSPHERAFPDGLTLAGRAHPRCLLIHRQRKRTEMDGGEKSLRPQANPQRIQHLPGHCQRVRVSNGR